MRITYDTLLHGLKDVQRDNHVIVNRGEKKVQEVSSKRFLLFSNVLAAAKIVKNVVAGDKSLEGEKKLSQLRKLNAIYSTWEKSIKGNSSRSIKDLESEQKNLNDVIKKMHRFEDEVTVKVNNNELVETVTPEDNKELQKFHHAIAALEERRDFISATLKNSKNNSPVEEERGILVWNKWIVDKDTVPSFNEFKKAFKESFGIEAKREVYDRRVQYRNEIGIPRGAENTWIHLNGINNQAPNWKEFKSFFTKSMGFEPEKKLYKNVVSDEIKMKNARIKEINGSADSQFKQESEMLHSQIKVLEKLLQEA